MILEGPWYMQIIKAGAALLLIGTVLWRMIKGEWWWKKEEKARK